MAKPTGPRKQEEAAFHNRLRSEALREKPAQYRYLTSNRKYYSIVRKSRDFVNEWLKQRCPGSRALDYCCGNGDSTILMAKNGAESIGIDISDISIENCKRNTIREGLDKNVSFFVMDAENTKFGDDYFDMIICSGVLHHLDTKKAFKELARILKPNGEVICIEPLRYNPLIQLYRKLTLHLRTRWEAEHILTLGDLDIAKKHFEKIEVRFFHLFTLLAVPLRNSKFFNTILTLLEAADSVAMKLPLVQLMAWQMVFILSKPLK